MKHKRGIELGKAAGDGITYEGAVLQPNYTTFEDLPEWNKLGGHCPKCEREAWVDRWELRRKWGNAFLGSMAPRLRCRGCGNKEGNRWIVGRLPR